MLLLLAFFGASLVYPRGEQPVNVSNVNVSYFDQLVSHNSSEQKTFQQRYYQYDDFAPATGSVKYVILDIAGESDGFGGHNMQSQDMITTLAQDLQATVFAIEHRYFGTSFPADSSTENYVKYLTVAEVLGDLAYFAQQKQAEERFKGSKWLLVGGSYSGLLSALARQEYPDVFHAALSSSGVVLANDNYRDFDLQIAVSMGHECAAVARQARMKLERLMEQGDDKDWEWIQQQFGAKGMRKDDFYFVIGEMFTLAPQYGAREKLCGPLVDTLVTKADPLMVLANFSRSYFVPRFCGGDMVPTYSRDAMKEMEGKTSNTGSRSWMWMTCNELAYWQVSPGRLSIRPKALTPGYFKQQCEDIFGPGHGSPSVEAFNAKYGGLDQRGTRIFFSTGSQDPWTWTCVTEDSGVKEGQYAHTITGKEIGHCTDLYAPNPADPADLVRTRAFERELFRKWMAEDD